jgi:hypothetical protein
MSHVATISLEVKDLDALAIACKRLGFTLNLGQKTYRWYGRSVGGYPLPAGYAVEDLGKCEHAINVGAECYEIGVTKRRDGKAGWSLVWDFFDRRLLAKVGNDACILKREYAAVVAAKQARAQGFRVQEWRQQDGGIKLQLSK